MTKRTLAGVQRPHGTALIACHLPEHKPPVGSRMIYWRVTADHQRHTPAKPSKVNQLGHMLFQDRQSMQRNICHTPKISQRLLQSEDLVRGAATRAKTALAILQF